MKKRFLSILLSLAMVLTMIPFATMTAFADDLNIHEFLESRLPVSNSIPTDAWKTFDGKAAYLKLTPIIPVNPGPEPAPEIRKNLILEKNEKPYTINWNTTVEKSGSNYKCTSGDTTCTFVMRGNSLAKIVVKGSDGWDGTYRSPKQRLLVAAGVTVGITAATVGTIVAVKAIKNHKAEEAAEEAERKAAEEEAKRLAELEAARALVEATTLSQNKIVAKKNGIIRVTFEAPKLEGVVGYEIQRATDKAFTKNVKTYNNKKLVRNNSKNLKKGTKYFYRVRAKVQLADGSIVYTDWSNVRRIRATKTR